MTGLLSQFQQLLQDLPEDAAAASTELLLRQMAADSAELLRRCAIPHQFNLELLRALVPGLSKAKARAHCEEFCHLSVIIPVEEGLALHDQVRNQLFTAWLAPSRREELGIISLRLVEHFTRALEKPSSEQEEWLEARRLFHLIGADQGQGVDEFERLFRQRRHAFRLTACSTLCSLVHEYDRILTPLNAARLAYQEGKLHADQRQWSRAEVLFRQVLATEDISSMLRVKALSRLGMVFAEQRQGTLAIEVLQQALALARQQSEEGAPVHRILHEMGVVHRDSGNLAEAVRLLDESLALAGERGMRADLAVAHNSLGTLYHRQGELRQAIASYEKSLEYLEGSTDRLRCAQVYNNLGTAYSDLREWQRSEGFFRSSLELESQASNVLGQARTLNNLARVFQNLERPQQAIDACQQAIALFSSLREDYGAGLASWNLGKLYGARKRELARQAYDKAIGLLTRSKAAADEAERVRQDLRALDHRTHLPWWYWMPLLVLVLLFVLGVVATVLVFVDAS